MPRLLLPAIISALVLGAHQFHFGHLDANWNSHSRALELTVRLHADDLEALLRKQQGRGLELDRDPQAERLACAYVLQTVAFDDLRLRCIGMEVSTHFVTLFLEGPSPASPRRARFQSLAAEFPDQVNTLQMQQDGKPIGPAVPFLPANTWKPLPAKK
ncbi:MAG: hypothetical protein NTV52_36755 [Acidobacteria bacterium]|nr:hypothetical protein [Acidobacteriota bacterium]